MNCKNCNAVMRVDQERKVFVCPYCESTEPFEGVSKAELQGMLHDAIRDVRKESIQEAQTTMQEQMVYKDTRTKGQKAGDIIILVLQIIFCLFLAVCSVTIFTELKTVGLVSLCQLGLMIAVIILKQKYRLTKKRKLKCKLQKIKAVCSILVLLLIGGWFAGLINDTDKHVSENVSWPTQGLGSNLPQPEGKLTHAFSTKSSFSADVSADKEVYLPYVEKCKEAGFTIDAEESDGRYEAYDENDNKLTVEYSNYTKEIEVTVDKGISWSDFQWPTGELAGAVPQPEAEKCCLERFSKNSLTIYVGDVTREQFLAYITECQEAGFDGYYDNASDRFHGTHKESIRSISIEFQRERIMRIEIYEMSN